MKGNNHNKTLVYYLGNKQRMAEYVADIALSTSSGSGPSLDLFSGTGSVSRALSINGNVYAVDIQEYSRVLCSALIEETKENSTDRARFLSVYKDYLPLVLEAYAPLINLEKDAWRTFSDGNGLLASSVIEHGCCMEKYRSDVPYELAEAMKYCAELSRTLNYDVPIRYFGGTYFSYQQAAQLSALRFAADAIENSSKERFVSAILSAASRCTSTVGGQFAQPIKTIDVNGDLKRHSLVKVSEKRRTDALQYVIEALDELAEIAVPRTNNKAVRMECGSLLDSLDDDFSSIIYADPPYSRYHYSRYYHVLETLALGDDPGISVNPSTGKPSRGLYRPGRYQSPYSTKGGALSEFEALFKKCVRVSPSLMLSYSPYPAGKRSTPRMVTIDQLRNLAGNVYRKVEVRSVDWVSHSKLNQATKALESADNAEVLLICRR